MIRLAVVPVITGDPAKPADLPSFLPDRQLLDTIATDLDARRVLGTRLIVEPPFYQRITAEVVCTAAPRADADRVRADAACGAVPLPAPARGRPGRDRVAVRADRRGGRAAGPARAASPASRRSRR